MTDESFEIFLATYPGLEAVLLDEVRALGFAQAAQVAGGVTVQGGWPEVWRANLRVRGATRVLARIGAFRAMHPAQLDKRARRFDWGAYLRADVPVRVEATCKRSRIYHAGAARSRVETALTETLGVEIRKEAGLTVRVRIEDDLCTLSLDTSGSPLHLRGHKQFVGKAPLRETLAALLLRKCGYVAGMPLVDPMCGSGTFVLEAAEISAGLAPGRGRRFAFEDLVGFDPTAWGAIRSERAAPVPARCLGFDRDAGAIAGATDNAKRAGVETQAIFARQALSDLVAPESGEGLVMVNPPYGARIGNKKMLFGLYATLGTRLQEACKGWRVGLLTSEPALAHATGLEFADISSPIPNGGLKVKLFQTAPLA